jgi:hypothetical protein
MSDDKERCLFAPVDLHVPATMAMTFTFSRLNQYHL